MNPQAFMIWSDAPGVALALAGGLGAGALYFAGLWWTVRRLARQRVAPAALFASWLLRALALMGVLYWLMGDSVLRLAVAVAGVMLARLFFTRRARAAMAGPAARVGSPDAPYGRGGAREPQ